MKFSAWKSVLGGVILGVGTCLLPVPLQAQDAGNIALNQPVGSSGPNWGSFKPEALTDGDPSTFTHPAAASGTTGFTYEVDLGATRRIERIVLRNRNDGCCPERLSRIRVEVWSDAGGSAGQRRWSAPVRGDGSHSGVGGTDIVLGPQDPSGDFIGRFVRVVNASGAAYNPQLAEIEVYGGTAPVVLGFEATEDTLEPGQTAVLRWTVDLADGVWLEPGSGGLLPGQGEVAIAPETTTTYTLVATNAFGSTSATVLVGVGVVLQPPDLTEFMADNPGGSGGLEDEDGDSSDWIELFNPNPYSLRLGGYFLTDDPNHARRWRLPDVRVPPWGFRVVFASGKDRRDPAGPLHTDFRLASAGEVLALMDRDGTTVLRRYPEVGLGQGTYPAQPIGVAYGRGSTGETGFLRPSTPGATNGPAWAGIVANLWLSHGRGLYDTNLAVEIATVTPGARIRYTTDRSVPTETHGMDYQGPIAVTGTTVLRAAAFRAGWAPSEVETHTFIVPTHVIASSVMRRSITTHATYGPQLPAALRDLPSLSLISARAINGTTEVDGSIEWIPTPSEGTFARGDEGTSTRQAGCGIRLFGGAFTDFAKKNFRLYFRSEYGASRFEAPLFAGFERGLAAVATFDQLELRGGSHDMAMRGFHLGNVFTDDTLLEMGHLNPHGRFVHLYLNGSYWGVYHLRERWGAAMHRRYLGGTADDYESINGNWNVGGWAEPGVPYDGDGSTWARVKALRSDYPAVREWLNVPQFVDFMLMWLFGGAEDEYRCVGPTVPGSGFQFYLNDADGWFCIPAYCAAGNRTGWDAPGRRGGDGPGSLFSMLHAAGDPDYRVLLADRIHRSMTGTGALTPARNQQRLLRRSAEFERPFLAEAARWSFLSPTEWEGRRNSALNGWLPRRTGEVLAQFQTAGFLAKVAIPILRPAGGEVPPGTDLHFGRSDVDAIHFTLDGTDPRLPGGAVSPSARAHLEWIFEGTVATSPAAVRLDANTLIKARARKGTEWSALTEAFFRVGPDEVTPGDMVVRELHFHPGGTQGVEFVELENVSGRAINLRGSRFVDGITYAFPAEADHPLGPGQRLVLVNDLFGFRRQYGMGTPVAGVFAGRLDDVGERIQLNDGKGATLVSFTYRGVPPWPTPAAGGGYTLVLARPERGLQEPDAWRASAQPGGTPGTSDALPFVGAPEVDADRDGLPAIVEYALGTDDADPASGRDSIRAEQDAEGWFTIAVTRQAAADAVILRVEASQDLREWTTALRRSSASEGLGKVRDVWGVPAGDQGGVFLRLSVERRE